MSSELKTPIQSFLMDLETVIKSVEGLTVYKRWISPKAKLPCITMLSIAGGKWMEAGIGQVVSADLVGVLLPCFVQLDIWARSEDAALEFADKVVYALWANRESFGDLRKGIKVSAPSRVFPSKEADEKVYRFMMSAEAVYGMTKQVSS